MADLYIVDFGGDDDERARRAAERDAERGRLRGRYVQHLVARAAIHETAAERVMAALFDPRDAADRRCECACHPRLSSEHGDGLDCRCTRDDARQAEETRRREEFWDSEVAVETPRGRPARAGGNRGLAGRATRCRCRVPHDRSTIVRTALHDLVPDAGAARSGLGR